MEKLKSQANQNFQLVNKPFSVHTKFYSRDWWIQSIILVTNNNSHGEELKNQTPLKFLHRSDRKPKPHHFPALGTRNIDSRRDLIGLFATSETRKKLEAKYAPHLILGSLLETCRSAIGQYVPFP